jgi:hypothetical protein
MESLMTAAARGFKAGDPLGALNRVALRDDAPALALRGIAMVQHGRFPQRTQMSSGSGLGHGLEFG